MVLVFTNTLSVGGVFVLYEPSKFVKYALLLFNNMPYATIVEELKQANT